MPHVEIKCFDGRTVSKTVVTTIVRKLLSTSKGIKVLDLEDLYK